MLTCHVDNDTILKQEQLLLAFDGSCEPKNPGGVASAGWVIFSFDTPLAEEYQVVADGNELATNNFAEYCGLGLGLKFLADLGWRGKLKIKGDSQLVFKQISGEYACRKPHLQKCLARIFSRLEQIGLAKDGEIDENTCTLEWVRREFNVYADYLTQKCYVEYTGKPFPKRVKQPKME
jgi:ribonuclease HI